MAVDPTLTGAALAARIADVIVNGWDPAAPNCVIAQPWPGYSANLHYS